jgi:hypothetical protein
VLSSSNRKLLNFIYSFPFLCRNFLLQIRHLEKYMFKHSLIKWKICFSFNHFRSSRKAWRTVSRRKSFNFCRLLLLVLKKQKGSLLRNSHERVSNSNHKSLWTWLRSQGSRETFKFPRELSDVLRLIYTKNNVLLCGEFGLFINICFYKLQVSRSLFHPQINLFVFF